MGHLPSLPAFHTLYIYSATLMFSQRTKIIFTQGKNVIIFFYEVLLKALKNSLRVLYKCKQICIDSLAWLEPLNPERAIVSATKLMRYWMCRYTCRNRKKMQLSNWTILIQLQRKIQVIVYNHTLLLVFSITNKFQWSEYKTTCARILYILL